jgi:hypothetical protein
MGKLVSGNHLNYCVAKFLYLWVNFLKNFKAKPVRDEGAKSHGPRLRKAELPNMIIVYAHTREFGFLLSHGQESVTHMLGMMIAMKRRRKMKKNLLFLATALMSVMLSPSQADVSTGLIAYYPFNGNANDASVNHHDGVVDGATLDEDRYGNLDGAYLFDGIDDSITVTNHNDLNPQNITISLWIKILSLKSTVTSFVSKSSFDVNSGYIFPYIESSKFGMIVNTDPNGVIWDYDRSLPYSNILNPNLWHLYTATYDGSSRKVYIDGVLRSTDIQTEPSNGGPITSNTNNLVFGGQPGYGEWAHAIMDDIRIYNRALSADEIMDLADLDKDHCKNDGWTRYGFDNQGQCIQYVNTGK